MDDNKLAGTRDPARRVYGLVLGLVFAAFIPFDLPLSSMALDSGDPGTRLRRGSPPRGVCVEKYPNFWRQH